MFFKPVKTNIDHSKYKNHKNLPVNAERILTISAAREAWYPDNEGIPVIRFWFGDKDYHDWFFEKGFEEIRDRVIESLLSRRRPI